MFINGGKMSLESSYERYIKTINFIFDNGFQCELDAVNHMLIEEDIALITVKPTVNLAIDDFYFSKPGGVQVKESKTESYITEALSGVNRFGFNEHYLKFINRLDPSNTTLPMITTNLTINQLAELIAKNGSVRLVTPEDLLTIYKTINDFFNYLDDVLMYSFNFKGPEAEDLGKLTNLKNTIINKYKDFIREGDRSEQLFALFTNSFYGKSSLMGE